MNIQHLRLVRYPASRSARGPMVIILLCGGDKGTQPADIRRAIGVANDWKD